MTRQEIKGAIEYGKAVIDNYKKDGETVPSFVYERIFELYEELVKLEENK